MIAYAGLFLAALLAATILPMGSEPVLVGLLLSGTYNTIALLVVATVGNVAGSVLNWVLGRYARKFQDRHWFPASPAQMARAEAWYLRYGKLSLLLSWVPIIGDPITVVAGALRTPLLTFTVLVTCAKAVRYMVLAWATLTLGAGSGL